MNMLIVAPWLAEPGGVSNVVRNVAREMRDRGHNVILMKPGESDWMTRRDGPANFTVYELNLREPSRQFSLKGMTAFLVYLLPSLYQMARLISKNAIDIVNVHFPRDDAIYFAILRRIVRFKLVLSLHGSEVFPYGANRMETKAFRFVRASTDAAILPSGVALHGVVELFPDLASKGVVIHNAVHLAEFESLGRMRTRDGAYIVCVAHLQYVKGVDILLRAFEQLSRKVDSVKLLLVGGGGLRTDLEAMVGEMDLSERIQFLGIREPAEVKEIIAGSTLLVLPSRAETFGIVVLEAFACRKPVVASAVGGLPEIVKDGVNGVLVEPDNPEALYTAMRKLLDDPGLRRRLGEEGYRTVTESFRWELAGAKYEAVFRGLLSATCGAA